MFLLKRRWQKSKTLRFVEPHKMKFMTPASHFNPVHSHKLPLFVWLFNYSLCCVNKKLEDFTVVFKWLSKALLSFAVSLYSTVQSLCQPVYNKQKLISLSLVSQLPSHGQLLEMKLKNQPWLLKHRHFRRHDLYFTLFGKRFEASTASKERWKTTRNCWILERSNIRITKWSHRIQSHEKQAWALL